MAMTSPRFSDMSLDYQEDVLRKLSDLESVSEDIYKDMRTLFRGGGYILSLEFRKKSLQRIVEKDVFDYAGMKSYETQVKDLFAARLCPSLNDDALSETEVKDDMQTKIKHFYRRNSKIKVTVESKTLNDGMNVRYIVFNGHIELQILTLNEYNILETTHKDYEDRRSRRSISVQSTDVKVIYFFACSSLERFNLFMYCHCYFS